jgi:ArsR family transcriptional regulator, arsenate/arsenite/antimonite-responsive transcriptional repressor
MDDLSTKLKALADTHRLNILEFLLNPIQSCCSREEGVCACDLEAFLGLSQPTVSHHMKLLVQAGFVKSEKRGRWVYYDLNPGAFEAVTQQLSKYQHVTAKVG